MPFGETCRATVMQKYPAEKLRWAELVEGYLASDRNIQFVVQIIDIRHKPTENDLHMIEFLMESRFPFAVVVTKSDKLNKTQRAKQLAYLTSCSVMKTVKVWFIIFRFLL